MAPAKAVAVVDAARYLGIIALRYAHPTRAGRRSPLRRFGLQEASELLGRALGLRIEELRAVPQNQWATERIGDHMRTDFPTLPSTVTVRDALTVMEQADVNLLTAVDGDAFVGVVTTTEILRLDEILDETRTQPAVNPSTQATDPAPGQATTALRTGPHIAANVAALGLRPRPSLVGHRQRGVWGILGG